MTYSNQLKGLCLKPLLLIAIGSALGGVLRYLVSQGIHILLGRNFPYGTLSVNLLGCLLMGLLFVLILEKFQQLAPGLRPLLLIGLLGGFTTFSSFTIETINLWESEKPLRALINILTTTIGCITATWLGVLLGRGFK
ncbi:MAG: crcB 2 [Gammaproteobacteria bacterium]|jgi:CrcB protein|nr:crcB 2 [Gammaproteobacteria bacterium]